MNRFEFAVENPCSKFVDIAMLPRPEVDMQEVDQFGFVNLADAFDKGIIPSTAAVVDSDFNGVANPGTLISRSTDVFDGYRKAEYVRQNLARLSAEEREKAENQIKRASEKSPDNVDPAE